MNSNAIVMETGDESIQPAQEAACTAAGAAIAVLLSTRPHR